MTRDQIKNLTTSIHQKLMNKSIETKRPFNDLLQYYAMERFLYRLSKSNHFDKFILKGALTFWIWQIEDRRSTMDIDMLGRTRNDHENILAIMKEICDTGVEKDGLIFNKDSVKLREIKAESDYKGVRVSILGCLGNARVNIQIDIGFGDALYPSPTKEVLPCILSYQPTTVLCYCKESVVAEKFHAMIELGIINSRMKDFFDISLIIKTFDFDFTVLCSSVQKTFDKQGTKLTTNIVAFSDNFISLKEKEWKAFIKKQTSKTLNYELIDIIKEIKTFIMPVVSHICENGESYSIWRNKKWE